MIGKVSKIFFFSFSISSFFGFIDEKRTESSFLCLDLRFALTFLFSFSFKRSDLLKMRIIFALDL